MHVPEWWVGDILLRADFRAFYEMELAWDQPLAVVLGESLGSSLTSWYRLAWCLAASERGRLRWDDFLDLLPADIGGLGAKMMAMVDEAISPICPVSDEPPRQGPPRRIRWSQFRFEGSLVGLVGAEWWRSTFRIQQALLWEYARHHDPEGKSGRPLSEEEIEAINNATAARLMAMGGVHKVNL